VDRTVPVSKIKLRKHVSGYNYFLIILSRLDAIAPSSKDVALINAEVIPFFYGKRLENVITFISRWLLFRC